MTKIGQSSSFLVGNHRSSLSISQIRVVVGWKRKLRGFWASRFYTVMLFIWLLSMSNILQIDHSEFFMEGPGLKILNSKTKTKPRSFQCKYCYFCFISSYHIYRMRGKSFQRIIEVFLINLAIVRFENISL